MTGPAKRAAVKFLICFVIAVFIGVALLHTWPAGFFKSLLYVAAGGTCIALLWPSQEEGDALIKGDAS